MAETTVSRGHKKRARTRLQLIEAGLVVLAEKGEALTASDVVAEAGVSNGTFYNYFDDREELFVALAEHLAAAEAGRSADELDIDDPAERFAVVSARVIGRAAADPTWGWVVLRLATRRDGSGEDPTAHLRRDLRDGHAQGRFAAGDDPATVDLVSGALLMAMRRVASGPVPPGYVTDALTGLLSGLGIDRDEARDLAVRSAADTSPVPAAG